MFCQNCGAQIADKAVICVHCGVPTGVQDGSNPTPAQQPVIHIVNTNTNTNTNRNTNYHGGSGRRPRKSKWIAFFLCVFLGYFGAHRFYVGKNGTGLVWLFTCGLCGIGWIVDCITIFIGTFRDNYGYALK